MTDEPVQPLSDDAGVAAAELALGLLEGDERANALRRLLVDPEFARMIDVWRDHFATLLPGIPAVAPPTDGLARLQAALDGTARTAPAPAPAVISANDNAPVRRWRAIAGMTGLVAAGLVAALVLRPAAQAPSPTVIIQQSPVLIASIDAGKGAPIAAVFYPDKNELRIAAATLADAAHSAELWVIATDGVPHSLGTLKDGTGNIVIIDRANARRFVAGSKLVVTREQPGGSPDGTPKGPAIAAGPLQTV